MMRVLILKKRPSHQTSLTKRSYQSMRKKRKVECKTFSKPTLNEVSINFIKKMYPRPRKRFVVCFRKDDHDIQKNINWISCNKCPIWIHIKCANIEEELPIEYQYVCQFCKKYVSIIYIIIIMLIFKLTFVKCLIVFYQKKFINTS